MSAENTQTPSAQGLASAAKSAARKGPPPVHLWHPPYCGALDMRIARDGTWFYEGTPIGRQALVKLFASILRLDPEGYRLVTPVEMVGIQVEDVPFVAVDCEPTDKGLRFETNLGDSAFAGPDNPIRMAQGPAGDPVPYVTIRRNLEARIDRKTFYRLIELGEVAPHEGQDWFGLRSGGVFFPVHPADALDL